MNFILIHIRCILYSVNSTVSNSNYWTDNKAHRYIIFSLFVWLRLNISVSAFSHTLRLWLYWSLTARDQVSHPHITIRSCWNFMFFNRILSANKLLKSLHLVHIGSCETWKFLIKNIYCLPLPNWFLELLLK